MKQCIFEVTENRKIAPDVYCMKLHGDTSGFSAPGQFLNIKLDGMFLRRPISMSDVFYDDLLIVYKVVGKGTEAMSKMEFGVKLDVLTGLGNGYDTSLCGDKPLLIGGGAGVPPLYFLARQLLNQGKDVTVILGFNNENEVFFEPRFRIMGCNTIVKTVDGSHGIKGSVTDALPED